MHFGLRIPPCAGVDRLAVAARRAEELGIDSVWFPDSQLLWRDAFLSVCVAALNTERIGLGIAVTNPITRHASVLASAARTVQEICGHRFVLGIGVGNSSVEPINRRPATRAQLDEVIATVRALTAGEGWKFGSVTSRLESPAGRCPIYVAATGPKNVAYAASIGEGVILLTGLAPAPLESALSIVRAELAQRSDPVPRFDIVASCYCYITDDVARDARLAKPLCVGIALGGGRAALASAGVEVGDLATIGRVEPDLLHARDWSQAVAATNHIVSDEAARRFVETFCLFGTPAEVADRLVEANARGVTSVYLQHLGSHDLPHQLMDYIGEQVMPLVRDRVPR